MNIPVDKENIINLLGIQSLPEERRNELVSRMATLVQKRLVLRLFESLDMPSQERLKELLDSEDAEPLKQFLVDKAPDLSDWLEQEVLALKSELLSFTDDITK